MYGRRNFSGFGTLVMDEVAAFSSIESVCRARATTPMREGRKGRRSSERDKASDVTLGEKTGDGNNMA